jgi:hypothetical protein
LTRNVEYLNLSGMPKVFSRGSKNSKILRRYFP